MAVEKKPSHEAEVGAKVLDGLAKGRRQAIAQAKERHAQHVAAISILLKDDIQRGQPDRGRAGRIARRMGRILSERHIKRILATQLSVADSIAQNGPRKTGGLAHAQR